MLSPSCDAWNNLKVCRHPIIVSWLRLREEFIKLDMDNNSLRSSGRIGFRGFLINSKGRWLMSFIGYRSFGSNLLPGLLAIKYDLFVTCYRDFRKVIYNSNSTNII